MRKVRGLYGPHPSGPLQEDHVEVIPVDEEVKPEDGVVVQEEEHIEGDGNDAVRHQTPSNGSIWLRDAMQYRVNKYK